MSLQHGEKIGYNETVLQQFINFKIVNGTVRRGVLYNILIEFRDDSKNN
jgi:hypothetical protein